MKPDIDCLKNLSSTQLQQLRGMIETLGYRKAAERASEEFHQPIYKHALQRFMRRAAPADFLEDTPENDEPARQVLKFAADGTPDFTASTLRALEQLAFQLAFTCTVIEDDMHALSRINAMLCRFRNTSTRERMAAVQEGKLKLRQQQFEKSVGNDAEDKIQELNRKIAEAFDSHPVLTAIQTSSPRPSSMGSAGLRPAPAGVPPAEPSPNPEPSPEQTQGPAQRPAQGPAPVPPKNKNSEIALSRPHPPTRSEGGSAQSLSSATSAKSAVNFPPSDQPSQTTESPYEIRNPQSELRHP